MGKSTLLRTRLLNFDGDSTAPSLDYCDDAVVSMHNGEFTDVCSAATFTRAGNNLDQCEDLRPALLLPGFIDTHIHFPQMAIIASFGEQLLHWLDRYAYPAERAFADRDHTETAVGSFLDNLYAAGTTSACVFTTVHEHTTDILMRAAADRHMALIAGKVLMNRNAPHDLLDGADMGIPACERLIRKWHRQGRLHYAVTPRFPVTSTPQQLKAAGELLHHHEGLYVHSHLAENHDELAAVAELYPEAANYTDIYVRAGLVSARSIFAHGIYLDDHERAAIADNGASIAFCPTSNLFLGSGLLAIDKLTSPAGTLAVATDIGAGTSYSLLATLSEGYKVAQLQHIGWSATQALHAITLGNAQALGLDQCIGRIAPGYAADCVMLDTHHNPVLHQRIGCAESLEDELFAMMMMGDERIVARTYVAGDALFSR